MRIHLVKKQTLEDFKHQHPGSKISLEDWAEKVRLANWEQPGDIKKTFNSADLLGKKQQPGNF